MMRTSVLWVATLSSVLGLASCGLGDASEDLDAVVCQTSIAITGTFTPGTKPADFPTEPLDPNSCWPVGKWSFTVTKTDNPEGAPKECAAVTFESKYDFDVVRVAVDPVTKAETPSYDGFDKVTYLTAPTANTRSKISQGGSGSCAGIFEIFTADGKTIYNLHPALNPLTNTLTGNGEVVTYEANQWKPPT
ncbi:MAG: hypothetical protein IPI49_01570 [Myxococcales bacterium]|nr:hypothetical protein [Myxococcales bacterium]